MRILLINHYAGSDDHGMEFRPFRFAKCWRDAGHDVTVMAGSFSHLRNANPAPSRQTVEGLVDGIRYRWIPTRSYRGNGLGRAGSVFDFLAGLRRESRSFLREWVPDAVIASSTYPFDIYPATSIARQSGAVLVWEVHDLWPLSLIELAGYSRWNPLIMATQLAEDRCCKVADLVVSILPHADRHLRSRGMPEERYLHIPNGADVALCTADEHDPGPEFAKFRLAHKFVVCYAGTHSDSYDLETLLEAISTLDSEIGLVMLGDGPAKPNLAAMACRMKLGNVLFLPRATRRHTLRLLSCCDAAFVGLCSHPLFRFGVSMNKIFDAMSCGVPIVASYSASNDPVTEAGCGITVTAESPVDLAEAIRRLAVLPKPERDEMGSRGRSHVISHHDYRVLADRFVAAIERSKVG